MEDNNISAPSESVSGGKKIQYPDILKNAFLITWKNKFLWFFGFLILLASISFNFNANSDSVFRQQESLQKSADFIQSNPTLFTALALVLFFVLIAIFLLRIMAVAGIIKSVSDIGLYSQLSVFAILREAKKYLWRLLAVEFFVGVLLVAVALVLAAPILYLFVLKANLLAYCIMVAAFAIILPLAILACYLHRYAVYYIVLANENLKVSLESAYNIFTKNIKESLMMGLVSIGMNLALIIVVFLLYMLSAIVFVPFGVIAYLLFAKTGLMVLLMIVMPFLIVATGLMLSWYESFLQTAWFLFFQQLAFEKNKEKKIVEKMEAEEKIPAPEIS